MPASVELTENGRILHYIVADPWTYDDMERIVKQGKVYYDTAPRKLHVFVDASGIRKLPPGLLRARRNNDLHHPNSGHIAVIGAAPVLRAIIETILRLTHFSRARFFRTEAEAWAYLRQVIADETKEAKQGIE